MGSEHPTVTNPPDNPITEIAPDQVQVWPDDTGGVAIEIYDTSVGRGFKTILDQLVALDVALRLIGAVGRLRGIAP